MNRNAGAGPQRSARSTQRTLVCLSCVVASVGFVSFASAQRADEAQRLLALLTVADDQLSVGVGHVEAVDHHQRLHRDLDARAAEAQHLRDVRVAEEQPAVEFVILLVEGPAAHQDGDHRAL